MTKPVPARLAVLISGNGTNLQAIIDACSSGLLHAQVVVVATNQKTAYGLERAKNAGIPTLLKEMNPHQNRKEYDEQLAAEIVAYSPDWVVLAGWMRILTQKFIEKFPDQVINIHPALPGTFIGTHAIERAFHAFKNGEISETGVMVHLVPDEGVDCGPILAQESITIDPSDTLESLEERIHQVEHELLIQTLGQLIEVSNTGLKT